MGNKNLMYLVITFQVIQWLGVIIYILTLLDYSWLTTKVLTVTLISLAIVIYNCISIMLIYLGSRNKKRERRY
jgi:hypothetical protein